MTLDTALYIGEAGNKLLDGTQLIPGVTVCAVPLAEAEASDNWSPIDPADPTDAAPPSVIDGGTFRRETLASGHEGLVSPPPIAVLDGGTA